MQLNNVSVLVLIVVRISSIAGLSKSVIVICALWALPFLRPRSPVLSENENATYLHTKILIQQKSARHKPKHAHNHSNSNPKPSSPVKPVFFPFRKALGAFSILVHPFSITQRKLLRRSHRQRNSSVSSTSSSPTSSPAELSPDSTPIPTRPSLLPRRSSFLLRQQIANVFRKNKTSTSPGALPKDPPAIPLRKPLQRRATVHFCVPTRPQSSRPRASTVPSVVAPITDISNSAPVKTSIRNRVGQLVRP